MSSLVTSLKEEQAIEASLRPEPTLEAFRSALDRGYIHLRFSATRGGTELGVTIDSEQSDLTGADLDAGTGSVVIVGKLILDYVPVRLHARIELPGLHGVGHLEPIGQSSS